MLSVTGSVDKSRDWEGQEVALTTNVEEWYEVADLFRSGREKIRYNRLRNSVGDLATRDPTVVITKRDSLLFYK